MNGGREGEREREEKKAAQKGQIPAAPSKP